MAIQDDFSITGADIRYTGDAHGGASPGYYTVLELHRYLQDYADDAVAAGDDLLDITDDTPSDRSTDNIITLINSYNIDATAAEHLFDGSISQGAGATIYAGLVVVGAVPSGTELQIVQNNALLTSYWGTGRNADPAANILLRIMVETRTASADIDGRRLRVQARELGNTYAEFSVTMGLGNNTAAIFTSSDLNNQTAAGTIATWTTITNTEGYQGIDVSGDGTNEFYYAQWDLGSQSINDLYERTKWVQRRGTATTIHGMNGELFRGITHQVDYTGETGGPFVEDEVVSWGTGATAGTGALLALDDQGTTGTLYMQLLSGVAPNANTMTGGTSSATATAGTVTTRTISPAFIGSSTGSAIIGAYGIGIDPNDLTASDQLFDLTNSLVTPPNNVTFTVAGLVSGEDRVLVGPESGATLDTTQLAVSGVVVAGVSTSITVATAIPSDTPSAGTIRVFNGSTFVRETYTSWTGSVFTLTGTATDSYANAADMFISYIDELAGAATATFTSVFNTNRSLFVRVRDGGGTPIKTFQTTGSLGAAGGSTTAIRTSDA